MILGDVLKYLNGLCAVIHKNQVPTNGTSSLSDNAIIQTKPELKNKQASSNRKPISFDNDAYTFNWAKKNKQIKEKQHCEQCNSYSDHIINYRLKEKRCLLCGHETLP